MGFLYSVPRLNWVSVSSFNSINQHFRAKNVKIFLLHPRLFITILDLLNLNLDLENKTQLPHILYLTLTRFNEWKISNDKILQCFGPKCFVLFRFIWFVSMQCHSKRSLLKQVKKSTMHLFELKSLSKGIVGLDLRFRKTKFFFRVCIQNPTDHSLVH